jgi:hypothetical protein
MSTFARSARLISQTALNPYLTIRDDSAAMSFGRVRLFVGCLVGCLMCQSESFTGKGGMDIDMT